MVRQVRLRLRRTQRENHSESIKLLALLAGLLLLTAGVLLAIFALPPVWSLDVGTAHDESHLTRVFDAEQGDGASFRWTRPGTTLRLDGTGGGLSLLSLRFHSGTFPADTEDFPHRRLQVMRDGSPLAEISLTAEGWRTYHMLLPPGAVVDTAFAPVELGLAATPHPLSESDSRVVGIALDRVELSPLSAHLLWVPAQRALLLTWALAGLAGALWALHRTIGTPPRCAGGVLLRVVLPLALAAGGLIGWAWWDVSSLARVFAATSTVLVLGGLALLSPWWGAGMLWVWQRGPQATSPAAATSAAGTECAIRLAGWHRVARGVLLGCVVWFGIVYLLLAFLRLPYPFELEWMEGAIVHHMQRVLAGEPLYVQPTLDFVPFIYAPLYVYLSAVVATITGAGFLPLRLVSLAASLAAALLIGLIVRRATGNRLAALLAVGLFAASYNLSDAWFDIARGDTLFLALVLLALALLQRNRLALAGVVFALAYLTKQTTLVIALPMMFYVVLWDWRRAYRFILPLIVLAGGSTLLLDWLHNGWYSFYALELPGQHKVLTEMYLGYWLGDILTPLPIALLLALFYLLAHRARFQQFWFFGLLLAGMLGGSWGSRLHSGGFENVLMPAHAALAISFGLAFPTACRCIELAPIRLRPRFYLALYTIYLLQFGLLLYAPPERLPTASDRQAGYTYVQTLSGFEGEIYSTAQGYIPALPEQRGHAHWNATYDVFRGNSPAVANALVADIRRDIRSQRFSAIVISDSEPPWLYEDLERYYTLWAPAFVDETVFRPVTGAPRRPEWIYVPRTLPDQ